VRRALTILLILLLLGLTLFGAFIYLARKSEGIAFLNTVRYEVGEHKGAAYCRTCHQEIYAEWKKNSRHAISITAGSVRDVMYKLKKHTILNYVLGGEDMCYACHGPKAANEGIDCETCHGPALSDTPIVESHDKVFRVNMAALKKADFCAKCHEIPGWVTPYSDWKKTNLDSKGITCQACHMAPRDGSRAYHGFDSFVINQHIYDGYLSLSDIRLHFPTLTLSIENHIKAHGVPAGGPTRILSLEILCSDGNGKQLHKTRRTFAKYHRVLPVLGFWPYKIVADSQLKTGERRALNITLPAELEGRIKLMQFTLRFYEVADEYEGDIAKAYFVSEPILMKEFRI